MTATHHGVSTARTGTHLLLQLDDEWAHLRTSRRALRTARGWADMVPGDHPLAEEVADLRDLDDLRLATQPANRRADVADAILLALVALSSDDELAGRIVLQRLLPGLIVQAARHRSFTDRSDATAQVIPAAWMAIRCYDVDRRSRHVAAALISDATYQAFRRARRRLASTERVCPPSDFVPTPWRDEPSTALDEFVTVLRDAHRAGVPAGELDLLRQLVSIGTPGAVAQHRNVTPRTIRNHRDRAIASVRTALAVGAAA